MDYLQRKKFNRDYQELASFLGDGFPDADFDNLTDEEVAKDFAFRNPLPARQDVIEQARNLLAKDEFPFDVVSDLSNRYFENVDEAREWLIAMIKILEKFEG